MMSDFLDEVGICLGTLLPDPMVCSAEDFSKVAEAAADMGAAADGLAQLCRLVAAGGLQVTVEFLPWSGIPTIAAAARLIDAFGEPNAGVLLDTWHWTRQPCGPDVDTLRSIAPERIGYMQLSDVAPVAGDSLLAETMTNRLLPGDGVVDFAGLFTVLEEMGATPFVSSEVFNTQLVAQGAAIAARQMHDACVNLLGNVDRRD